MSYFVFLLTILLSLLTHSSEVIFDVVSSVDSSCTTTAWQVCLTLSDFIAHHSSEYYDIVDSTILILGSGNHILTSTTFLNITNISSFSMVSETQAASIICSQQASFKFVHIGMVEIVNISFIDCEMVDSAVLEFEYVDTVTMKECEFINSKGNIVLAYQSKITIIRTAFVNSSSYDGITLFKQSTVAIDGSLFTGNKPSKFGVLYAFNNTTLTAFNSSFEHNRVDLIGIVLIQNSQAWFTDVNILGNRCRFGALYLHESALETHDRMIISRNVALLSTMYLVRSNLTFTGRFIYRHNKGTFLITNSVILFSGVSRFSNNRAGKRGGAITSIQSRVHLTNTSSFLNNSAKLGGAISAYESEIYMNGKVKVADNKADTKGGGVYLYQSKLMCEGLCSFLENFGASSGGGIHAFSSLIILGNMVWSSRLSSLKNNLFLVANNEAQKGGGLSLEANSRIYGIGEDGYDYKFEFLGNHASYGGAIFVDDYTNDDICTSNDTSHSISTECFFQTLYYIPKESVVFIYNHAIIAGRTLFGGLLDRCTMSIFAHVHGDRYQVTDNLKPSTPMSGLEYFQNVTNILDIETIDSDASRICFCMCGEHNSNCDIDINNVTVMKGEAFNITLVAVNQVAQPVNATVISKIQSNKGYLDGTQYERNIPNTCTNLTFNVYSLDSSDSLIIYAEGPCREKGISQSKVDINFRECKCPLGFEISKQSTNFSCKCGCHHVLQTFTTNCNITSRSFLRESNFWIKHIYHRGQGYLIYSNCPFDYCRPSHPAIWINLNIPYGADDQCAPYRTGLLCSMCKPGYSLSVGGTHCMSCHRYYHLFAVLLCLGSIGFGIALVILMLTLNLTVAVGTINGIIFYANVVSTNSSIFLPFVEPNTLTVFIALLNLNIGFDTCLYKGMNTYVQTWLLFVFPVYLIALMVVIILLCKYSSRFAQIIGKRNPVATLATLLLLFYTKLLQTIIRILSFVRLNYPDGSQSIVWLPDASVAYFKGLHFPLVMMALLAIAVGLTYTVVLFAWQWLLRLPRSRLTSWIRNAKLSAFIYMYHVPYTPQHRYWTGLLLLTRIVLYLVFDLSDDPKFRLLAITLIATSLLLLKAMLGRKVYKRKLMDYLDTVSIFNILVFSLVSFYTTGNQSSQKLAAKISIGSAIIIFLFIICYHTKSTILEISLFKRKLDMIKRKDKRDRNFEMNTESAMKVTSSEVSVSPAHTGTDHTVRDTDTDTLSSRDNDSRVINLREHGDNALREPLLL